MSEQQNLLRPETSDVSSADTDPTTDIQVLPPQDVFDSYDQLNEPVDVVILDPWYNKGVGGERDDYDEWLLRLVHEAATLGDHVFLWGFPYIIYKVLDNMPEGFKLVDWLVWYYKNCPSVIRGWRSAHNACLHLAKEDAPLYPEHFLNEKQQKKYEEGTLRYIPGPTNVIEAPLNIGFVGRDEQTGHPSQKPVKVFEQIIKMATVPGDTVFDPMCGGGTTGVACHQLGRKAILCDASEEYLELTETRFEEMEIDYRFRG